MPHKGRLENNNRARNYSVEELNIIRANLHLSNKNLQIELLRHGFDRSITSIKYKKNQLSLYKSR
jgi:hypothetical protein